MTPKKFDYVRATGVDDAVDFLSKHPGAKVLAGGQSLIPLMKLRLASPSYLLDIGQIPGLSYVRKNSSTISIGALTTHETIEDSPVLKQYCPILPQMASQIGDQQIRNRGTIGGSLVHADPSGDPPAAILALDAELKLVGPGGSSRKVRASEFFVDTFQSVLAPNEILTEIILPSLDANWFTRYRKYAWRDGDFAIVGFAGLLEMNGINIKTARIAYASMDRRPIRASALEQALTGRQLTLEMIKRAREVAAQGTNPASDVHVSDEFRVNVAKQLVDDFLSDALDTFSSKK